MKRHPTNQLNVVVDHVPRHLRPGGGPGFGPVGLVAFHPHQITRCGDLTVQFGGGHLHVAFCREASRRLLHQGKRLGHHLFQHLFQPFVHLKLEGVDLLEERLLLVQLRQREFCRLGMQLVDLGQFRRHVFPNAFAQVVGAATQVVRGQVSQRFFRLFHPVHNRLNLFDVVGRFVPDKGLEKLCKHDTKVQREPPGGWPKIVAGKTVPKKCPSTALNRDFNNASRGLVCCFCVVYRVAIHGMLRTPCDCGRNWFAPKWGCEVSLKGC